MMLFKKSFLILIIFSCSNIYAESNNSSYLNCVKEKQKHLAAKYHLSSTEKSLERLNRQKEKLTSTMSRKYSVIDTNLAILTAKLADLKAQQLETCETDECKIKSTASAVINLERRISSANKRKESLARVVSRVDQKISVLTDKLPEARKSAETAASDYSKCSTPQESESSAATK